MLHVGFLIAHVHLHHFAPRLEPREQRLLEAGPLQLAQRLSVHHEDDGAAEPKQRRRERVQEVEREDRVIRLDGVLYSVDGRENVQEQEGEWVEDERLDLAANQVPFPLRLRVVRVPPSHLPSQLDDDNEEHDEQPDCHQPDRNVPDEESQILPRFPVVVDPAPEAGRAVRAVDEGEKREENGHHDAHHDVEHLQVEVGRPQHHHVPEQVDRDVAHPHDDRPVRYRQIEPRQGAEGPLLLAPNRPQRVGDAVEEGRDDQVEDEPLGQEVVPAEQEDKEEDEEGGEDGHTAHGYPRHLIGCAVLSVVREHATHSSAEC